MQISEGTVVHLEKACCLWLLLFRSLWSSFGFSWTYRAWPVNTRLQSFAGISNSLCSVFVLGTEVEISQFWKWSLYYKRF